MKEGQERSYIAGPISSGDRTSVREWLDRLNSQAVKDGKPLKFVSGPVGIPDRVGVFVLVSVDKKGEENVKNW